MRRYPELRFTNLVFENPDFLEFVDFYDRDILDWTLKPGAPERIVKEFEALIEGEKKAQESAKKWGVTYRFV